jgi:hypothetical protein
VASVATSAADAAEALKTRQTRRDELAAGIAAREAVDVGHFNRKTVETKAREHMQAWCALLTKRHVSGGRQLLREVLTGPLRFRLKAEHIGSRVRARDGEIVGWYCRCYN